MHRKVLKGELPPRRGLSIDSGGGVNIQEGTDSGKIKATLEDVRAAGNATDETNAAQYNYYPRGYLDSLSADFLLPR